MTSSSTESELEQPDQRAAALEVVPSVAPPSGVHDRPDPPSFSLEGCVAEAEAHVAAGKVHEAMAEYKRALLLLGSDRTEMRARLYVELGELTRSTGNARIAANNFVKALAITPLDDHAFRGALDIARELGDWRSADELHRGRASAVSSDSARIAAWRAAALVWLVDAKDPVRASSAVEQWLALAPGDAEALGHLVVIRDAQRDFTQAIDARRQLATVQPPKERAASLADAAVLARDRLGDVRMALELAGAALEADPEHRDALALAEALHQKRESWTELASLYERILAQAPSLDLALRLATLARERLSDLERAARAQRRATEIDPKDAGLERALAEIELERADFVAARRSADRTRALAPRDARSHRLSYDVALRSGDGDAAFTAAMVLDWLGEAEITESVLADAHRPEGLLGVQGNLMDQDWDGSNAFADCTDVAAVLAMLTPAAIDARLELERRRKTPGLDESTRQDLAASTATMMRALVWASRVLGMEPPAVYVTPDLGEAMIATPIAEPSLRVNRDLGRGLGLKELAFLWGRGLTVFRPAHRLAAYYPDADSLAALFVAARAVAGCKKAATPTGDAKILAGVLESALDPATRDALRKPLKVARNPHVAAERWLRAHELSCSRAGLLVCGDIADAIALIERFPFGTVSSRDEQVDDLCAWSSSAVHGELRRRLGVAVAH